MTEVISLGAHERMTPEEALAVSSRENWDHILIIGFQDGEEHLSIRSSAMTREFANWIIDHAKRHALGVD